MAGQAGGPDFDEARNDACRRLKATCDEGGSGPLQLQAVTATCLPPNANPGLLSTTSMEKDWRLNVRRACKDELAVPLAWLVGVILLGAGAAQHTIPASWQSVPTVEALTWSLGDHWTWQRGTIPATAAVAGAAGGYALQIALGSVASALTSGG